MRIELYHFKTEVVVEYAADYNAFLECGRRLWQVGTLEPTPTVKPKQSVVERCPLPKNWILV